MNIKIKKIIAKEIIFFFSIILLLILIWSGIKIWNSYINNEIDNSSKEITALKKDLKTIKNIRFLNKNEKIKFNAGLDELNEYKASEKDKISFMTDFIAKFSKKEISEINENDLDEIFYLTPNKSYVSESLLKIAYNDRFNSLKQDKTISSIDIKSIIDFNKLRKIDNLNQKIKNLNNKQQKDSEIKILIINFSIILFCLVYPIRLIYILLKWSFLTIKTKI